MKFGFKELDQVLAASNNVPEEGRSRFAARLRNLFRLGLNLPTGRGGQRTNYGPEDLLKMALAVELLQIGLLPEKVIDAVARNWPEFRYKIAQARLSRLNGRPVSTYMVFEPALMTMGRELSHGNFNRMVAAAQSIFQSRIIRSFRRAAVINIGMVWDAIEGALDQEFPDKAAFLAAIDSKNAELFREDVT